MHVTPRILLVDDSRAMRMALRIILSGFGWACEEAETGESAIQRLGQGLEVDAVVVDYQLAGWRADRPRGLMSGVAFILALRGHPRPALRQLPVLCLTAQESARESVLLAGGDGFLLKPALPTSLKLAVEEAWKRRGHPAALAEGSADGRPPVQL